MNINNNKKLDYVVSFSDSIEKEKLDSVIDSVRKIQSSISWDEADLYFAKLRLSKPDCPKILVRDESSKELLGYATLVKRDNQKAWYISQIAVNKEHQRRGIGKSIMHELFAKAMQNNIATIDLDMDNTDPKLIQFYRSFKERATIIETRTGYDRFGKEKLRITYKLNKSD